MIKIMVFIFLKLFIGNVYAEKIDFCRTIEFDMGDFDRNAIKKASERFFCRDNPIPLVLNYQGEDLKDTFNLDRYEGVDTFLASQKWDRKTKQYNFVSDDFAGEQQYIYTFNRYSRKTGVLSVRDSVLLRNKLPYSKQRDLFFFKEGAYGASYSTNHILLTNKKGIYFMEKVTDLFKSMEINW